MCNILRSMLDLYRECTFVGGQELLYMSAYIQSMSSMRERNGNPTRMLGNQHSVSWKPRPTTKKVDWGVVNEMPNQDADETILALVDLRRFNDLLLQCSRDPPIHHVTRSLVLVSSYNEASVMRTQAGGEHASTPWPPRRLQFGLFSLRSGCHDLHVVHSMQSLFLTRI